MSRRLTILLVSLAFACSREQPAPPATASTPPPSTATTATQARAAAPAPPSYEKAVEWMRSAPRFAFVLDEQGTHATGVMSRETIGAERVEMQLAGDAWRAQAGPKGVTWSRKSGSSWKEANPPELAPRLYQRVTVAFDPQKKEGAAQLAGNENGLTHYRFTDANTGELHEVWVRADGSVARMKIGDSVALEIEP
jgi:hypothetical protein